jgi:hypothetical protein
MSIKNITWPQVAILTVLIGAAFAAHYFLGAPAGMAAGVVTSIIAFLMGRSEEP